MSSHMQPADKSNQPDPSKRSIITQRYLHLPTTPHRSDPHPCEISLTVTGNEEQKTMNHEALIHYLEQALAHHVSTSKYIKNAYEVRVEDFPFIFTSNNPTAIQKTNSPVDEELPYNTTKDDSFGDAEGLTWYFPFVRSFVLINVDNYATRAHLQQPGNRHQAVEEITQFLATHFSTASERHNSRFRITAGPLIHGYTTVTNSRGSFGLGTTKPLLNADPNEWFRDNSSEHLKPYFGE